MSYITREDGEHFVIPSYRDVLTAKQGSQLKKEILLLSQSYGEFITMQRKGTSQYEVAFSPDTGYLLGESVWQYFKRPLDMVYCEAIPNTTEAILVIVKSGSVYLDGSFPMESIPEELVIFLTQENNFDIYTYGDVPISQQPETGKFSFEAASVHAFTVLDKPVFPTLPLQKQYQLQHVEQVLRAQGIGVYPIRTILTVLVGLGLAYFAWSYLMAPPPVEVKKPVKENPYKNYLKTLSSFAPDEEMNLFLTQIQTLYGMPGWKSKSFQYDSSSLSAQVYSVGGTAKQLYTWADDNKYSVNITTKGYLVYTSGSLSPRSAPTAIYPIKNVIGEIVDRLGRVLPGNNMSLSEISSKGPYKQVTITIQFSDSSPLQLKLIGDQLKDLPVVMQNIKVQVEDKGVGLSGTIILTALGN